MHPVETYLRELQTSHATGAVVPETAYYGHLQNLLNIVGSTVEPKLICAIGLKNQGAGLPDGGLFSSRQIDTNGNIPVESVPAYGAIEIKSADADVREVARSEQVKRYVDQYGQVLVTNYREFLLVEKREEGIAFQEQFTLVESGSELWSISPSGFAAASGERLLDYLRRAFLRRAPLTNPRDVSWFLASYAREAKRRVDASELDGLRLFRESLEEALEIEFEGSDGLEFFRSTLVQTLFYGVFSAWVLWSRREGSSSSESKFDWRTAAFYLHVPVLRRLFHIVSDPGQLEELRLDELLDWAGDTLNRIVPDEFFERFNERLAVQYFYEPFLEAFDPDLRRRLGVWYTPPEVVKYMVARVDSVLRNDLGIEDGLADQRVYVLDPACGTGTYLVEVLEQIATTLAEHGEDALLSTDLKKAAMERVFGFELLPAPFVVAHLQLGLFLQSRGAPLSHAEHERVGVYLTNSLGGWNEEEHPTLPFQELQQEREAAEQIKREAPILVVLGNPPYSGYAGIAIGEERELTDAYKETVNAPKPN